MCYLYASAKLDEMCTRMIAMERSYLNFAHTEKLVPIGSQPRQERNNYPIFVDEEVNGRENDMGHVGKNVFLKIIAT